MGERNPSPLPPPFSGEGESSCRESNSPSLLRGGGEGEGSVTTRVLASRRYRHVDPALVERLAEEEAPKAKNLADAEKRTKRRLHQIFGAYTGQPDYTRLMLDLSAAWQGESDDAVRDACRTAMAAHASTRERLAILDEFYEQIFAITGVPTSIVDIACGLNPLGAPWMHLPDDTYYVAYDIDSQMLGFVDGALELFGIDHRVALRDIVSNPPDDTCDLALLLKSVPCLDQQDTGASARIIRAIAARRIVVTFPTRSLGGHGKGMARNYRTRFESLLAELGDGFEVAGEVELANELIFVVARDTGRGTWDAD
jgi:16S rRNA (guanine(1405)-N(7))-methyltransferase